MYVNVIFMILLCSRIIANISTTQELCMSCTLTLISGDISGKPTGHGCYRGTLIGNPMSILNMPLPSITVTVTQKGP